MDCYTLLLLASVVVTSSAWSAPFYTVHRPLRVTRYAPLPPLHRIPIPVRYERWQRPKRGQDEYDHDRDRDHDHDDHDHKNGGVTGPVHTFVKTDKNANYKWGVRHHVGNKYKS
ncbi:uncharacterized protein LOC123692432 [Colias croceus]|uniref:uncharacterized protein LOC123692432 n=1 Tax=Colias crocea TaxID=72248 RepID=UPI001E27D3EC|nr:uncharacterized protein LOC123692432 [Colias croceus]